jgi:hypothetical protein
MDEPVGGERPGGTRQKQKRRSEGRQPQPCLVREQQGTDETQKCCRERRDESNQYNDVEDLVENRHLKKPDPDLLALLDDLGVLVDLHEPVGGGERAN